MLHFEGCFCILCVYFDSVIPHSCLIDCSLYKCLCTILLIGSFLPLSLSMLSNTTEFQYLLHICDLMFVDYESQVWSRWELYDILWRVPLCANVESWVSAYIAISAYLPCSEHSEKLTKLWSYRESNINCFGFLNFQAHGQPLVVHKSRGYRV